MRRTIELVSQGFTDVVLYPRERLSPRVEGAFAKARGRGAATVCPTELASRIERFPPRLRQAIEDLFANAATVRTVDELARVAGTSVRALSRSFNAVGLSAKRTLIAAHAIRAFTLMSREGMSVRRAAEELGFNSPDQVSQYFKLLVGLPAGQARRRLSASQFAETVGHALCGGSEDSNRTTDLLRRLRFDRSVTAEGSSTLRPLRRCALSFRPVAIDRNTLRRAGVQNPAG